MQLRNFQLMLVIDHRNELHRLRGRAALLWCWPAVSLEDAKFHDCRRMWSKIWKLDVFRICPQSCL